MVLLLFLSGSVDCNSDLEVKVCLNDHDNLFDPLDPGMRTRSNEPIRTTAMFNVSVTLIQGYPPAIRVSWNFTEQTFNVTSASRHVFSNQIDDVAIGLNELGSRLKTFQVSYHPVFSRSVILDSRTVSVVLFR